jgi:hypothetical protein
LNELIAEDTAGNLNISVPNQHGFFFQSLLILFFTVAVPAQAQTQPLNDDVNRLLADIEGL